GDLRDRARPRLRLDDRDWPSRPDPARPEGHRGLPGRRVSPSASASSSPILEVRDLTVEYGAIQAVKGISLKLSEGEIVTLIGANGAGKSTTLRAIMGLVPCAGGEVRYRGEATRAIPTHKLVRDGLVLVPEGRIIFANLSVQENLEMGAYA